MTRRRSFIAGLALVVASVLLGVQYGVFAFNTDSAKESPFGDAVERSTRTLGIAGLVVCLAGFAAGALALRRSHWRLVGMRDVLLSVALVVPIYVALFFTASAVGFVLYRFDT